MRTGYFGGVVEDKLELIEVNTYVLDGIPYYPHYMFMDHYAMPGCTKLTPRIIGGDKLRELGATATPRMMWTSKARAKQ